MNRRSHYVYPTVDGHLQCREVVKFEPAGDCPSEAKDEILAALEEFETACQPADPETVFAHVSRMYKTTRRRSDESTDEDLAFLLWSYVDDLGEFPADVVAEVCNERRRSSEWWPMPAVLIRACREKVERRRGMRDALRHLAERVCATPESSKVASLTKALAERKRIPGA